MQVKRLISKRVRKAASGIDVVGDVQVAVSVNVSEPGTTTTSTSRNTSTDASAPSRGDEGLDQRGRENS